MVKSNQIRIERPGIDFKGYTVSKILNQSSGGEKTEYQLPKCNLDPVLKVWGRTSSIILKFVLHIDGSLSLQSYAHADFDAQYGEGPNEQTVDFLFKDDFWLVLEPFPRGPEIRVPFKDGTIIENESDWEIEDQTIRGQVCRVLNIGQHEGLHIDVGMCFGLLPATLLPPDLRSDLDSLVGKEVDCEIIEIDSDRGIIILRPIRFYAKDEN